MSETLKNPSRENDGLGHYKFNLSLYANNIFTSRPSATYESTNCGCGCTIYEADDGD